MKTRRRKKRKASRAQLAALAKGRAARSAKLKSSPRRAKRKNRRKVRSLLSKGKTRPAVRRRKARRAKSVSHVHKNPFLGELAMIGNPRRKRRKSSRKARRSSRRSRGMRLFANPGGKLISGILAGPKEMATMGFAQDAASVAVGFVLPNMVMARLPANLRDTRVKVYASKVAVVAGISAVSSVVSKRAAKMILLGGGVSLALDLWVDFLAPMMGQGAPAAGTGVYYGDSDSGMSGVGVYYGDSASSLSESFGG